MTDEEKEKIEDAEWKSARLKESVEAALLFSGILFIVAVVLAAAGALK